MHDAAFLVAWRSGKPMKNDFDEEAAEVMKVRMSEYHMI